MGKEVREKVDFEKSMVWNVTACGFALTAAMLFIQFYLWEPAYTFIRKHITSSNIIPYVVMITCFIVFYVLFSWILYKRKRKTRKIPPIVSILAGWGLAAIQAALLIISYLQEPGMAYAPGLDVLKHHLYEASTLVAMAGIFLMSIALVEGERRSSGNGEKKKENIYLYIFALIVGILYCRMLFTPNTLSSLYNTYHSNAYLNSVYNTLCGAPRSSMNCSIYGYYSLLLAPLAKLLGGNLAAQYYAICCIALIAYMCTIYALFNLVHNTVVKCAGIMALPMFQCAIQAQTGVYLQLVPNRTIFTCILVAYLVFYSKRNKHFLFWRLIGYGICVLALVWNFESGIVCLAGYVSFFMIEELKEHFLNQKEFYFALMKEVCSATLAVLLAFGFVNVVNLLMGGSVLSFMDFIFPMWNKNYFSWLKMDYQRGVAAWLFVVAIALILLGNGLGKTKLCPFQTGCGSMRSSVLMSVGILTLGVTTYYINRAVYGNLSIAFFLSILIVCVLTDYCMESYAKRRVEGAFLKNLFRSFSYVLLATLFIIAFGGIYNYENALDIQKQCRDMSAIEDVEKIIKEQLEPDTKALGQPIAALYSDLGWDSGYHLIDTADYDVYPAVYDFLGKELNEKINEPILIDSYTLNLIQEKVSLEGFLTRYEQQTLFSLYAHELVYWVPKQMTAGAN